MTGKRTIKYYRKNEREVMEDLGLKPTKNSGAGWIEKEDGQNEQIIAQLKSTDKNSIRVNKTDLDTLFYNAAVSHKTPVFVLQFLETDEIYFILRPCDVESFSGELKNNACNDLRDVLESTIENIEYARMGEGASKKKRVTSGGDARVNFNREIEEKYRKKEKSAL